MTQGGGTCACLAILTHCLNCGNAGSSREQLGAFADAPKGPEELVFGQHWRDWVRKSVRRVCVQAGVPSMTAHAMRGLHSTLALEHGASAHVVAASLGYTSISTTLQSYAKPELAGPTSGA